MADENSLVYMIILINFLRTEFLPLPSVVAACIPGPYPAMQMGAEARPLQTRSAQGNCFWHESKNVYENVNGIRCG